MSVVHARKRQPSGGKHTCILEVAESSLDGGRNHVQHPVRQECRGIIVS